MPTQSLRLTHHHHRHHHPLPLPPGAALQLPAHLLAKGKQAQAAIKAKDHLRALIEIWERDEEGEDDEEEEDEEQEEEDEEEDEEEAAAQAEREAQREAQRKRRAGAVEPRSSRDRQVRPKQFFGDSQRD